jgi:hypothetical protein
VNEQEVSNLIANDSFDGDAPTSIETVSGNLCINGLVALPVTAVDSSHNRSNDLEIEFDAGADPGMLCYCRSPGQAADPYSRMSDWRRVAFLTEAKLLDWGTDYHFSHDFLVLPKYHLNDYLSNYFDTAPIWGGFSHEPRPSNTSVYRAASKISVRAGLRIPTQLHKRSLQYVVRAAHPYDRFLRQYHQIELLFDWVFVKKIQSLGDDLEGVAKLMSEYSSGDLPRLKVIFNKFISNANLVRDRLLMPPAHLTTAKEIFDINNKDGNPLKDKWEKFVLWHAQSMTEAAAQSSAFKLLGDKSFQDFVSAIAAYWIYRVRCSIAHNRIGEYIMKESDEEFVVEFMEPLLKEVLCQIFSHPDLS